MNKASVREIMLQHEKTFKEQVHDLHKLYGKQKLLMAERIRSRERNMYIGAPLPLSGSGNAAMGEIHLGQQIKYWEQAMPDRKGAAPPKSVAQIQATGDLPKAPIWSAKAREIPESVGGPTRKRKIDLEKPPEDDSDDEMGNSAQSLNPMLLHDSGQLPKQYSGLRALPQQPPVSSLQTSPPLPTAAPRSDCGVSGDAKTVNMTPGDSCIRLLPSLPQNLMHTEQTFAGLGGKNLSFHNSGSLQSDASPNKSSAMFLPQADLIDRASHQETGMQAHWNFQSPETDIMNSSGRFVAQQQQSLLPHVAPHEVSSGISRPLPVRSHGHTNNKASWLEPMSCNMSVDSFERHSTGVSCALPKSATIASADRSGNSSNCFWKEPCSQASPHTRTVPASGGKIGFSVEGRHSTAGMIVSGNKRLTQEQDANIQSLQNPVLQLPQYQQQPFLQQHSVPTGNQSLWLQSSELAQNNMCHQQQIVYCLNVPNPMQTGYHNELLQRNPGDVAGSWNMVGLGHYYSSIVPPQKPPFKKPPKLVLKNDGIGMESKLVSPEKPVSGKEMSVQKSPSTSVKIELLQALSNSCENEIRVLKKFGQDIKVSEMVTAERKAMLELEAQGSIRESSENSAIKELSEELTPLAVRPCSFTVASLQGGPASVAFPHVVQPKLEALACTKDSETSSGPNLFVSQNENVLQDCAGPQADTFPTNPESEKLVERRIMNSQTSAVASEKESLGQINLFIRDMEKQTNRVGVSIGEIDMDFGIDNVEERKESSNKVSPDATMIGGVTGCQSESLDATHQGVKLKCEREDFTNEVQRRTQILKEDEGSRVEQGGHVVAHQESSESKTSLNANSSHLTDRLVKPAVSAQSISTDTLSISTQEKKRPLRDNDASQRVSRRLSLECKNESGNPLSERDSASAASPATNTLDRKPETVVSEVKKDIQYDSDSENIAASILLSFAPKFNLSDEIKQPKDTASEISSSIGKAKPTGRGRKSSRYSEDPVGSHSDHQNSASSQGRKTQISGRLQRNNLTEHQDSSKVTIKDGHRRDMMDCSIGRPDEGDAATNSSTIKLPRVNATTLDYDSIPVSGSKHLSKRNGVLISQKPAESVKKKMKAIHTPTGRRSSRRGPFLGGRGSLKSRSQLHEQNQHCEELKPSSYLKDSATKNGVCNEETFRKHEWKGMV